MVANLKYTIFLVALLTESVDWNWDYPKHLAQQYAVALLAESVDWNVKFTELGNITELSLSSRRAWIEITKTKFLSRYSLVALLAESVDWNYHTHTLLICFIVALLAESVDWNPVDYKKVLKMESRSPRGERGLKCIAGTVEGLLRWGRSPRGERGLKSLVVGATVAYLRRSPRGERGLKLSKSITERGWKCRCLSIIRGFHLSLSSRRAWIEILNQKQSTVMKPKVALLAESVDWNYAKLYSFYFVAGRSPRGERGLKSAIWDRNSIFAVSLSSRRAWIEILSCCQVNIKI